MERGRAAGSRRAAHDVRAARADGIIGRGLPDGEMLFGVVRACGSSWCRGF